METKNKVGYWEEAPGQKSSTRLNSFILLLLFVFINGYRTISNECEFDFNFIMFDLILLIGIFAPKYLQKIAELKFGKQEEKK